MKFLFSILLTAALSVLLQLFLPWWSLVIAAAIAGAVFSLKGFQSYMSGFIGVASVWWCYALMIDIKNQSILSERVAMLFHLGSPSFLILLCALIAGIVGGFAAMSGSEARKLIL